MGIYILKLYPTIGCLQLPENKMTNGLQMPEVGGGEREEAKSLIDSLLF